MNILYLAHRIPFPPNKGDKIRSFHQIKFLAKNHKIFLAAFVDEIQEMQYKEPLQEYCSSVRLVHLKRFPASIRSLFAIPLNMPLSVNYYRHNIMKSHVDELMRKENIDVCIIFSAQMAQYVLGYKGLKKVMDFIDVDSDKWKQYSEYKPFPISMVYGNEARRLGKYESMIARNVDLSIFTTIEDNNLFSSRNEGVQCAVVKNGIDLDYFNPKTIETENHTKYDKDNPRLVFVGAMDYFPNIDGILYFLKEVFPAIRRQFPNVLLDIVGRNPDPGIVKMARDIPGVIVTGSIPDVRPYYHRATVVIVPLRIARGIQNKVLEAMAMMLPIVVTRKAFEGIEAKEGEHLFVAEGPVEFSARVNELLMDHGLRRALGTRARQCVEIRYSWERSISELGIILENLRRSSSFIR